MGALLAGIAWDPTIRGLLIVTVAFLALCGSTYLLVATNLGSRVGFLVSAGGLFGWLVLLGLVWTVFGQGPRGDDPHWQIKAVVTGDISDTAAPPLDIPLDEWKKLVASSPQYGQAVAAVDEGILEQPAAIAEELKETGDYVVLGLWDRGGEKSWLTLRLKHAPHWAVVQLQRNKNYDWKADENLGQAPPKAAADSTRPVITVLMIRELGNLRVPPAMVMTGSAIIFALLMAALHRTDKAGMERRKSQALTKV